MPDSLHEFGVERAVDDHRTGPNVRLRNASRCGCASRSCLEQRRCADEMPTAAFEGYMEWTMDDHGAGPNVCLRLQSTADELIF
jgi:hypothetical protein